MALKHLRALSSGLTGKNNVYIPNINDFKTNALQRIVVYVPGFKATVERRSNGNLVVTEFKPDGGYEGITRRSREKPGVYRVEKGVLKKNRATYKSNGRITPDNGRNVVVADTSYTTPESAMAGVLQSIRKTSSKHIIEIGDFDMFYSPVKSKLGGMRSYTPEIHTQSYGFAGLLADAMQRSQKQTAVTWVSEQSGSVVLTQALQTLALKQVSFEEKRYRVCMHSPTTSPAAALRAISEVNMIADSNLAKGDGHARAAIGSLLTNATRAQNRNDHYTWGDYFNDLSGGTMAALSVAGATSFTAGAFVSSPALITVGAVCSTAGALEVTWKAFGKYVKKG